MPSYYIKWDIFDTLKTELSGKGPPRTPAVSYLVKSKKNTVFLRSFERQWGEKMLLEDYLNHQSKGNRMKLRLRSKAKVLVLAKKHRNGGWAKVWKVIKTRQRLNPLKNL